jgi:hypothetical protein
MDDKDAWEHVGDYLTRPFKEAALSADLEAAMKRLRDAGLHCDRVPDCYYILGGAEIMPPGEIKGYQKAFAIFCNDDGRFTAIVAEDRPYHDEEAKTDTLDQAVDVVLRIYQERGIL